MPQQVLAKENQWTELAKEVLILIYFMLDPMPK